MWPFSTKKEAGLIDRAWLSQKNLPIDIREAFQWNKKELKNEIKNYEQSMKTFQNRLAEKRSAFERNELKKSDLEGQRESLTSSLPASKIKNNQEILLIKEDIRRIALESNIIGKEVINLETSITQCQEVRYVLNRILKGEVKTPKDLTRKVTQPGLEGGLSVHGEDLPSMDEIVNNDDGYE